MKKEDKKPDKEKKGYPGLYHYGTKRDSPINVKYLNKPYRWFFHTLLREEFVDKLVGPEDSRMLFAFINKSVPNLMKKEQYLGYEAQRLFYRRDPVFLMDRFISLYKRKMYRHISNRLAFRLRTCLYFLSDKLEANKEAKPCGRSSCCPFCWYLQRVVRGYNTRIAKYWYKRKPKYFCLFEIDNKPVDSAYFGMTVPRTKYQSIFKSMQAKIVEDRKESCDEIRRVINDSRAMIGIFSHIKLYGLNRPECKYDVVPSYRVFVMSEKPINVTTRDFKDMSADCMVRIRRKDLKIENISKLRWITGYFLRYYDRWYDKHFEKLLAANSGNGYCNSKVSYQSGLPSNRVQPNRIKRTKPNKPRKKLKFLKDRVIVLDDGTGNMPNTESSTKSKKGENK